MDIETHMNQCNYKKDLSESQGIPYLFSYAEKSFNFYF